MKPQHLTLDTLSDRRDLFQLLHRLPPRTRLDFLKSCCRAVPPPEGRPHRLPEPFVSPKLARNLDRAYRSDPEDQRVTSEIYLDLLTLANDHGLDLVATAVRLEALVRSLRL